MKIFIITEPKYPSPSAVTTHLSLVANILLEGGHDVTVYGRGMTEKGEYNNITDIADEINYIDSCKKSKKK